MPREPGVGPEERSPRTAAGVIGVDPKEEGAVDHEGEQRSVKESGVIGGEEERGPRLRLPLDEERPKGGETTEERAAKGTVGHERISVGRRGKRGGPKGAPKRRSGDSVTPPQSLFGFVELASCEIAPESPPALRDHPLESRTVAADERGEPRVELFVFFLADGRFLVGRKSVERNVRSALVVDAFDVVSHGGHLHRAGVRTRPRGEHTGGAAPARGCPTTILVPKRSPRTPRGSLRGFPRDAAPSAKSGRWARGGRVRPHHGADGRKPRSTQFPRNRGGADPRAGRDVRSRRARGAPRVLRSRSMDDDALLELLPPVLAAVRAAGRAILDVYAGEFGVTTKSDRSPLTEADLRAHEILHEALASLGPGWPVLSEEEHAPGWEERRSWRRYWLVDPLDGTREFVKRNGQFTVNVALVEGHRSRFGVIHAPALTETYFGLAGIGAFASRDEEPWERLRGRRDTDETALRVLASRSHDDPRLEGWLARLGPHRRIGLGSSLKFCRLAAGEADLYVRLGPTSEWDTAAGQCILEAAGGWVCDLAGRPLAYNARAELRNPFFVAGRSSVEAELLRSCLRAGDEPLSDVRGDGA